MAKKLKKPNDNGDVFPDGSKHTLPQHWPKVVMEEGEPPPKMPDVVFSHAYAMSKLQESFKKASDSMAYQHVSEAFSHHGSATTKQIDYAASLAKKAGDWKKISLDFDLPPNATRDDLAKLSKKQIGDLITQLKANAGNQYTHGSDGPTTPQLQYVMGLMSNLGAQGWKKSGLDKTYPHVKLADLKKMPKSQISALIGNLKDAISIWA